jgi:hypothetical protein
MLEFWLMHEGSSTRTKTLSGPKNQIALALLGAGLLVASSIAQATPPPRSWTPLASPLVNAGLPVIKPVSPAASIDAGRLRLAPRPSERADSLEFPDVPDVSDLLHGVTGQALVVPVAARAGSSWTSESGLSWRSGQACHTRYDLERHRGRRHDVYVEFSGRSNFADVVRTVSNWHPRVYAQRPGRLSLALPMLTNDMRFEWQRCLNGSLDRYFLDIGRALHSKGLGSAIIRLGWEANGSGFPWKIRENVSEYKTCFQRQVRLLRSVAPGLQIDWTMRKATEGRHGAHMLYPGDQFVDIIGVNYYDWWPAARTQRDWDAAYSSTYQGGPRGLGTWLAFARSRGKKLSVPEWGVATGAGAGGDNPFYVQKMHETFRRNASSIAYEGYFNCGDRHRLYPNTLFPRSSAAYRQFWSSGG